MSYQPGIPTGSVPLNIDYQNIQDNFSQLDFIFNIDHIPFSQIANQGYHTKVHLVPAAIPAFTASIGQLVSNTVNDSIANDQILYWLTGNNRLLQLTRNFVPVTTNNANQNGYTFLPGGLIFQWGRVTNPGSSGQVLFVTDNINFPTRIFNVTLTLERNSGSQSVTLDSGTTPSTTQFSYLASSSGSAFLYWTALGI